MEHPKSKGGPIKRASAEVANYLEVDCGVVVSDDGYGPRVTGVDRSNRSQVVERIERRWPH